MGINWAGHEPRRVRRLLRQLAWRKTSFPADESVCFAILTGVNPTDVLQLPEPSRLAGVVSKLEMFPSSVLFMAGERCPDEGRAWVPKSFLNSGTVGQLSESSDGIVTPEGLRVEMRYLEPVPESTVTILIDGGLMVTNFLKMKLTIGGTEYHITSMDRNVDHVRHFWSRNALMLLEAWGHQACRGCLVEVKKVEGDVTYATPLSTFMIVSKGTVLGVEERTIKLGLVNEENKAKPLLDETFLYEAELSGEAEVHPPRKFCIG